MVRFVLVVSFDSGSRSFLVSFGPGCFRRAMALSPFKTVGAVATKAEIVFFQ